MAHDFSDYLIVSDVDGTLSPSYGVYPQRNIDAARRFRQQGGHFTIATGRPLGLAKSVIDAFEIQEPVIVANGGGIYDLRKGKYLYSEFLPETAREYLCDLTQNPRLLMVCVMAADEEVYAVYIRPGDENHRQVRLRLEHGAIVVSPEEIAKINWWKLLLVTDLEETELFRSDVRRKGYPGVDFVASSGYYYEMMPQNVSKGKALCMLADWLGVPRSNTIAMGDFENDLEMLHAAAWGVSPSDGSPEAKEAAKLVVGPCADGALADLVEHLEQNDR